MILLPLGSLHCACVEIDRNDLSHFHGYVGTADKSAAQIESDIARSQDCGGHLVEQGLELLIVILVEQRDSNVRIGSQLAGTVQSGETTTHNHNVFHLIRLLFDGQSHSCWDTGDRPWTEVGMSNAIIVLGLFMVFSSLLI